MKKYLFFTLIIILASLPGCKKEVSDWKGKIAFISGRVFVNEKQAVLDQTVLPGAEIKTGVNSVCDIIFNEKNIIRIIEKSNVVLDFSDDRKNIKLKSGGTANVLRKLSKADKDLFRIKTPIAVVAVRGTLFFVKIENQKKTYICDCNGIIQVSDINGKNSRTVRANHHKGMMITKTGSGFSLNDAGMLYHTDSDMEILAEKIGYAVDWSKIDKDD